MMVHTVVYLYKETLTTDDEPIRCWSCGWIIARYNRRVMSLVIGDKGPIVKELVPGMTVSSHVCHRCKKEYKIYFE